MLGALASFNTKKVRLKLAAYGTLLKHSKDFQYQKGAIKTSCLDHLTVNDCGSFQYQKGAIKTLGLRAAERPRRSLSIPKRCD